MNPLAYIAGLIRTLGETEVWFRCGKCGEGFLSDALEKSPVHEFTKDCVPCDGHGTRIRAVES